MNEVEQKYCLQQDLYYTSSGYGCLWKSNYKFNCPGCNKIINRGEWVTKLCEASYSPQMSTRSGNNWNYNSRLIHIDCNLWGYWTEYSGWIYEPSDSDYDSHQDLDEYEQLL
jgi:hypothetical protein